MSTRDKVLSILRNKGDYMSGEEIAKEIGVGRNSVWKAVKGLKEQGYEIDTSVSGYRLLDTKDIFDEQSIRMYLEGENKLYIYKKEGSSNSIAKTLCQNGEGEGSVVIVESQTQGRGRMGRSFISSSENGLYMSITLRPKIRADRCVNITVLCAVAVLEAIEELTGKECGIKWVNDIYIGDKKCCGILTEAAMDFESGMLDYAVVGIGVNLCPPKGGFDKEIEEIACGVYENECPCGFKARLCAKIIDRFFFHFDRIEKMEYIGKYREKSNIIGKIVDIYQGDKVFCGEAIDIDENANLIIKDEKGEIHSFNSGDARVRAKK